jgi:hypothetical protein
MERLEHMLQSHSGRLINRGALAGVNLWQDAESHFRRKRRGQRCHPRRASQK